MRSITTQQPQRSDCDTCTPEEHQLAASSSALGLAREAIARWRGARRPDEVLPSNSAHVSPQARWLEQAQAGLDSWIACGGFAQADHPANDGLPPLTTPVMYKLSWSPKAGVRIECDSACID